MELPQALAQSDPELLFHLRAKSSSFANGVSDSNYSPKLIPFEMLIQKYSFQKAAECRYVKLQVYTGKLMTFCDTSDHTSDQKKPQPCSFGEFIPHHFSILSQGLKPTVTTEAEIPSQMN